MWEIPLSAGLILNLLRSLVNVTCTISVLFLFFVFKRSFLKNSFFISQVLLRPAKQNSLQDALTVRLMVDFGNFIHKRKQCVTSWSNPTPNHTRLEILPSIDYGCEITVSFNWIRLLYRLMLCLTVNIWKNKLPLIFSGRLQWCDSFLKSYHFVCHRKFLVLFH